MTLDRLAIAIQSDFKTLDAKFDKLDAKIDKVHTELDGKIMALDEKVTKEFHAVREDLKRITDTTASKTDLEEAIREIKAEKLPERVAIIEKKLGIREHRSTGRMAA